jgi:protein CpxP
MKKLILITLLAIGTFFSSWAQKVPTAEEIAKKNIDEMDKRLKLTPTQRSVIYNYAFDMAKEQLSLYKKQQAGTFKQEDETKFFKLNNENTKNIKAVLKPEQIIEYNILTEERLNGIDPAKKKKKLKKGEEEEKVVGIEGLKSVGSNN